MGFKEANFKSKIQIEEALCFPSRTMVPIQRDTLDFIKHTTPTENCKVIRVIFEANFRVGFQIWKMNAFV